MKMILHGLLAKLPDLEDGLRFQFVIGIVRAVLQHAAVCAAEYAASELDIADHPNAVEQIKQLHHPVDGSCPRALDVLLPLIRNSGWHGCADAWYAKAEQPVPGGGRAVTNLVRLVDQFVQFRNDRPGHGVVDRKTVTDALPWICPLAVNLVDGLAQLLPRSLSDGSGKLLLESPSGDIPISTLSLQGGSPMLYRKIRRKGSVWQLDYQTLDPEQSTAGSLALADACPLVALVDVNPTHFLPRGVSLTGRQWMPYVCVPEPQTSVFEGRRDELKALLDWYNNPDSRACLVYGEGGIGKTTLVLEFLGGVLDGHHDLKWFPEVICFFSAKQTRWGPRGLEVFRGIVPAAEDAVRHLVRVLENPIDRKWYDVEAEALIDRVSGLYADVGIRRTEILLVLDNTETLAKSAGEEAELARVLQRIMGKCARLLVTSRRHERIEAHPIQILPLNEQESISLIERLATAYDAKPLLQAGAAARKKAAKQLGGKPLLIDVYVRYASRPHQSLDVAMGLVLRAAREDLGDFLFADAWERMDEKQREVFLDLSRPSIGNPVDGQVVSWACADHGMSRIQWDEAFEETQFGVVLDYGSYQDLQIDNGAFEFLQSRFAQLPEGRRHAIEARAGNLAGRYRELLKARGVSVNDRVLSAFRTAAAKVAYMKAKAGAYDDAVVWYEEAVRTDPTNGALWDRFAWYLMHRGHDLDRALECAEQACRLAPQDPDAHFTAGMVAGRLGRVEAADHLLRKAAELGKGAHLCALQQARARIEAASMPGGDEVDLGGARALIESARLVPSMGYLDRKHLSECDRVLGRLNEIFANRRRARG